MSESPNGRPAIETILAELCKIASTALLFVRAAERLRDLPEDDEVAIFEACEDYVGHATVLGSLLERRDWGPDSGLEVQVRLLVGCLDARWRLIKLKSGFNDVDRILAKIDDPAYLDSAGGLFWSGCEITYRRVYEDAVKLLEVLNQPVIDPGPVPFSSLEAPTDYLGGGPPRGRVILRGRSDQPTVNGKKKARLTLPQFRVLTSLKEAGDNGLSSKELTKESRHEDAVRILKRLRQSDPDWRSVIQLAGEPWGRYSLLSE